MEFIGNRISIKHNDTDVSIVILASRQKSKNLLLQLWFALWTIGGIIIFIEFFLIADSNTKLAIVVWLVFWGYFEFKIFKAMLWRKSGIEKIKLNNNKLIYKRDINGRGKTYHYLIEFIKDLRLTEQRENNFFDNINNSYWNISGEKISFDYHGKEIKLALNVELPEAKQLLKILSSEMKKNNS